MRYKYYVCLLLLLSTITVSAQQSDTQRIRIADTLTAKEKISRNTVILQSELDSLIKEYNDSQVQQVVKEPVKEPASASNSYVLAGLLAIIALLVVVIYMFYRQQQKINKTIEHLNKESTQGKINPETATSASVKDRKGKAATQTLEGKISDLTDELQKLSKENDGLNRVIKEYNGIQSEYDSLKQGIQKGYKIKNYPGYDKSTDANSAMRGVLETENAVAIYAYEKFLKPILLITDGNKNSPAKLSATDRERLLDLLISMSLLYIEYLYLRINDLSVGGKMVERIKAVAKGNAPDTSLLKKMDTEFGSRALVIKMALNKAELHKLSYPVFDETNLNSQ